MNKVVSGGARNCGPAMSGASISTNTKTVDLRGTTGAMSWTESLAA